jgi:hypothetical protein
MMLNPLAPASAVLPFPAAFHTGVFSTIEKGASGKEASHLSKKAVEPLGSDVFILAHPLRSRVPPPDQFTIRHASVFALA